jgi:hypothetical protein
MATDLGSEGSVEVDSAEYSAASEAPGAPPPAPPSAPRSKLLVMIAVVVVVVLVVVALVWVFGIGGFGTAGHSTPPTEVHVTVLTLGFAPGNNACFSSEFQTTSAQTVIAGGQLIYNVSLQDGNPGGARACTVTGLTVNTSGFSLLSSNLPVDVGTGKATLTFTLLAPPTAFNGSVVVDANVTFQTPNVLVSGQNFAVTGGSGECGSVSASGVGFSAFSGGSYSDGALVISISPETYCSVATIAVEGAPGFSIGATNLPVPLPIDSIASVTFSLNLPSTSYQGALNFTLTLS